MTESNHKNNQPETQTLPDDGCIKRIHVNQHNLRKCMAGEKQYVFTVQYKGRAHPCNNLSLLGSSEAVNSIDKPLSCGARLWIQTTGGVILYK